MDGINLQGADLSEASCAGACFDGANMNCVRIRGARFEDASFIGTRMYGVSRSNGAQFEGAGLMKLAMKK